MPTKQRKRCGEKTVIVQVYVERPRRVNGISPNHCHGISPNHCHHLHPTTKQDQVRCKHGVPSKGFNRKAQLLHYSRRLHESAWSATTAPPIPESIPSNNQQPAAEALTIQRNQSPARATDTRTLTCLGNYKISILKFLKSLRNKRGKKNGSGSMGIRVRAVLKHLKRKWRFWGNAKLLTALRKQT